MKALVVEDDFTSRLLLQKILATYGEIHIAVNGLEAISAFFDAQKNEKPYDLVCLDIMMPEMDGLEALQKIRSIEEENGVFSSNGTKIVMTTALSDIQNVSKAYQSLCDGYLIKPIEKGKLFELLAKLKVI